LIKKSRAAVFHQVAPNCNFGEISKFLEGEIPPCREA